MSFSMLPAELVVQILENLYPDKITVEVHSALLPVRQVCRLFDAILRPIAYGKLERDISPVWDYLSQHYRIPSDAWVVRLLQENLRRSLPYASSALPFLNDLRQAIDMLRQNGFLVPKSLGATPEPYEYAVCITSCEMLGGATILRTFRLCARYSLNGEGWSEGHQTERAGQVALQTAARFGDAATVGRLTLRGVPLEVPRLVGSAINMATRHGQRAVVETLLNGGDEAITRRGHATGPFDLALEHGHLDIAQLLLTHLGVDTLGPQEVHYGLCSCRETSTVRFLLQHLSAGERLGSSNLDPFKHGTVHLLPPIKSGASPLPTLYGSPFSAAVRSQSKEVVRMFLGLVTDVGAVEEPFCEALSTTAERGYYDICRLLLEHFVAIPPSWFERPLRAAVWHGHFDLLQLLLNNGGSCQLVLNNKLLMGAVRFGCLDTIRVLLERTPDLNMGKKYGYQPVYWAVNNGYGGLRRLEVVRLLLRHIPGSTADKNGRQLIYVAVRSGRVHVVQAFVNQGFDLKKCPKLLHEAVRSGSANMVRFVLFDLGGLATINARDGSGYPASTYAAWQPDYPTVLRLLLGHGGEVVARNPSDAKRIREAWPPGTFQEDIKVISFPKNQRCSEEYRIRLLKPYVAPASTA